MAIVRYLGKPAKFLTFTANPSWSEIARYLEHGQSPDLRPDLIAIVFRLKLNAFLHDIKKRQIFGRCIGCIHVIEYQKRGLPHAHILLFLHEDDVPWSAEQLWRKLSKVSLLTARVVLTIQILRVCEMEDARKGIQSGGVTWTNANGRFTFDNRWVVPYNPYLTMKYNSHINVEVARGVHAIKYLAKYVYKGSDRAALAVQEGYDEILMTIQGNYMPYARETCDERLTPSLGRYISPVQAIWRLMAYTTHEEKPAVMLLYYHMEGRHRVSFDVRQAPDQLAAAIASQSSIFLDWMKYNAAHTDGRD
ncbi:hypothetical protein EPUL_006338, partial [Erysiphe pulchra]